MSLFGAIKGGLGALGRSYKDKLTSTPAVQRGMSMYRHMYPKKTGKNGNGATAGSSAAYSEDSPYYQR